MIILGAGPAAIQLGTLLNIDGSDSIILVGNHLLGSLAPIYINGNAINAFPIVKNVVNLTEYTGPSLSIHYYGSPCSKSKTAAKGSLIDTMRCSGFSDLSITLAIKQYGEVALVEECQEALRKITKSYSKSGNPAIKKTGYSNGASPFLEQFQRLLSGLNLHQCNVVQLTKLTKFNNIMVKCNDGRTIEDDRIFSTIPLPVLARIIDTNSISIGVPPTYHYVGCTIHVFQMIKPSDSVLANRLQYDLDMNSPVFRVFLPTSTIICVQTANLKDAHTVGKEEISRRAAEILNIKCQLRYFDTIRTTVSYPLGYSSRIQHDDFIAALRESGIYLYGRLGAWQYMDIDDLPGVDNLVQRSNAFREKL